MADKKNATTAVRKNKDAFPTIGIMISSRCKKKFDGKTLSEIRKEIKDELEKEFLGEPMFDVWINEDQPSQPQVATKVCLDRARKCDIFLCLYNGDAGDDEMCLREFDEAHAQSPEKVVTVTLKHNTTQANSKFKKRIEDSRYFIRDPATDIKELKENVYQALLAVSLNFMKEGVQEASKKSAKDLGPALDWARLPFEDRSKKMNEEVLRTLDGEKIEEKGNGIITNATIAGRQVLSVLGAMPSSFSVSEAREMVGQPFLKDHELSEHLNDDVIGPVHIIACSKNITETQAIKLLGFPDAIIVKSRFGIYVADRIQKIQICLIAHCFDENSTAKEVERFMRWLTKDSDEAGDFIKRAESRKKIVKSIADENDKSKSTQP